MTFTFQKAQKNQLKARVAVSGPAGSGKTTTALQFARQLAGSDGRIALIDTERGSASLYSDRFDFDSLDFTPPYAPQLLIEAIDQAAAAGYPVLIIDSLSHFWSGEGGVLEQVDRAGNNKFTNGWGQLTPIQNRMVEKLLSYPGHVIVSLRSKTAYAVDQSGGRAVPRKVGQAPIQRDGLEYEFTLVLDMDRDHSIGISKTRCAELETTGFVPGSELHSVIDTFIKWLSEGEVATTSTKAAKLRLLQSFIDRGWDRDEAKAQAVHLWSELGLPSGADARVEENKLDEALRSVPAAPAAEADPFDVVDSEEVAV
jgi:DNA polymerase III delta prime subunit